MNFITRWLSVVLISGISFPAASAFDSPRIALVVGNGAYSSIGALPNPPSDARLIAKTLEKLGFDTYLSLDADQLEMKKQIADFGRRLRASSKDTVGFFYYAGHGVQAAGRNYLLPVEARPTDKADLDLMGVEANWVLRQMESAGNRTNIIVLDACRNNPFTVSNRSLNRGLAQIDAPTGSFISYATAPGKVALDGDTINSPFTSALAKALLLPGVPIEQVFKRVRVEVIRATHGKQIPWDSSSLVEDLIMQPKVVTISDTKKVATDAELKLWQTVSASNDPDRISLFLQLYPNSPLAQEARDLLMDQLMAPSKPNTTIVTAELPRNSVVTTESNAAKKVTQEAQKNQQLKQLEMINIAQSTQSIADYQRYMDEFPSGLFIDLAKAEIASINTKKPQKPVLEVAVVEQPAPRVAVAQVSPENQVLTMDTPLTESIEPVGEAHSIRELIEGSPLFPPFEGLDESYWKTETCSNCHTWDQPTLCKQGQFYTTEEPEVVARIKHPYGGFFKSALRVWASANCQ